MNDDSYFSVDRLVEFGIGMAVARQMVHMFNESMSSTTPPTAQIHTDLIYYVSIEDKPIGPLNANELFQLYANNKITKDSLGWMPGMPVWKPIEQIPSMLKVFALSSYYH